MRALRSNRIIRALAAASSLTLLWQAQAQASALQLEPVVIRLTPTARAAVMHLRNHGNEPLHVQIRAFHWEQVDGEDRLSATTALRVSPPIQQLPPGGEQIVRVLLAEDVSVQGEESFRLIVDELPTAPATDGQVQLLIRYSVPVTFRSSEATPAELHFRVGRDGSHTILEARNTGGQSAKLAELRLTTSSGNAIEVNSGLFGYVLPGRTRQWQLPLPADAVEQFVSIAGDVDGQARIYALEAMH